MKLFNNIFYLYLFQITRTKIKIVPLYSYRSFLMSIQGTCASDLLTWRVNLVRLTEPEQFTPTVPRSVIPGWAKPTPAIVCFWIKCNISISDVYVITTLDIFMNLIFQVTANFWQTWKEFEIRHGNEDTIREMLRIKRSVQATYNTQVNFMSSQMLKATTSSTGTGKNDCSISLAGDRFILGLYHYLYGLYRTLRGCWYLITI